MVDNIYFDKNRLPLFHQGRVVYITDGLSEDVVDVGHVESFGLNSMNEVVIFVRTARESGSAKVFHPSYLKIAVT